MSASRSRDSYRPGEDFYRSDQRPLPLTNHSRDHGQPARDLFPERARSLREQQQQQQSSLSPLDYGDVRNARESYYGPVPVGNRRISRDRRDSRYIQENSGYDNEGPRKLSPRPDQLARRASNASLGSMSGNSRRRSNSPLYYGPNRAPLPPRLDHARTDYGDGYRALDPRPVHFRARSPDLVRRPEPSRAPRREFYTGPRPNGVRPERERTDREKEARDYKTYANRRPSPGLQGTKNMPTDGYVRPRSVTSSTIGSQRDDRGNAASLAEDKRRSSAPVVRDQKFRSDASFGHGSEKRSATTGIERRSSYTPGSSVPDRPGLPRNTSLPAERSKHMVQESGSAQVPETTKVDTPEMSDPAPSRVADKTVPAEPHNSTLQHSDDYVNPFDLMDDASSIDESRPSTSEVPLETPVNIKSELQSKTEAPSVSNSSTTAQHPSVITLQGPSTDNKDHKTPVLGSFPEDTGSLEDAVEPVEIVPLTKPSRSNSATSQASTVHLANPELHYRDSDLLAKSDGSDDGLENATDEMATSVHSREAVTSIPQETAKEGNIPATAAVHSAKLQAETDTDQTWEAGIVDELLSIRSDLDDLRSSSTTRTNSPVTNVGDDEEPVTNDRGSVLSSPMQAPEVLPRTEFATPRINASLADVPVEGDHIDNGLAMPTTTLEKEPSMADEAVSVLDSRSPANSGELPSIEFGSTDFDDNMAGSEPGEVVEYASQQDIIIPSGDTGQERRPESSCGSHWSMRDTEGNNEDLTLSKEEPRVATTSNVSELSAQDSNRKEGLHTTTTTNSTTPNESEPHVHEQTDRGPTRELDTVDTALEETMVLQTEATELDAANADVQEIIDDREALANQSSSSSASLVKSIPSHVSVTTTTDQRGEELQDTTSEPMLSIENQEVLRLQRHRTMRSIQLSRAHDSVPGAMSRPRKSRCPDFDSKISDLVLETNKTTAATSKNLVRRYIHREPQEYGFFAENLRMYDSHRSSIVELLRAKKVGLLNEDEILKEEFEDRQKRWLKHTAKYDRQRLLEFSQEEEEATLAASTLAPSRGTRGKPVGFDIKEALVGIETPNNVLNEATIPRLVHDPYERELFSYVDVNDLVERPLEFYHITMEDPREVWTEEEQSIFSTRYKQTPKQFGVIAAGIPGRTPQECVLHYYKSKKMLDYRASGKPKVKASGRGRGRAKKVVVSRTTRRQLLATVSSMDAEEEDPEEEIETKSLRKRRAINDIDEGVRKTRALRKTVKKSVDTTPSNDQEQGPVIAQPPAVPNPGQPIHAQLAVHRGQSVATPPLPAPKLQARQQKSEKKKQNQQSQEVQHQHQQQQQPPQLPRNHPSGSYQTGRDASRVSHSSHMQQQQPQRQYVSSSQQLNHPFVDQGLRFWTDQDEALFIDLLKRFGTDYHALASHMPAKTPEQIQKHFDEFLIERGYRQYLPRPSGPPVRPLLGSDYMAQSPSQTFGSRVPLLKPPQYTSQFSNFAPQVQHSQASFNSFSRPTPPQHSSAHAYDNGHPPPSQPSSFRQEQPFGFEYRPLASQRPSFENRFEGSRIPERTPNLPIRGSIDSMLNSGERVHLPPIGAPRGGPPADSRYTPYFNHQNSPFSNPPFGGGGAGGGGGGGGGGGNGGSNNGNNGQTPDFRGSSQYRPPTLNTPSANGNNNNNNTSNNNNFSRGQSWR